MKKYRFIFLFSFIFSIFCLASCNNNNTFDDSTAPSDPDTPTDTEFGVTYSYYLNDYTDQIWAEISGKKGALLPSVTSPKKNGYRFNGWKTKDGSEPPLNFGSDDLRFIAQWEDSSTTKLIGSKSSPDTVGDIIFTDGSASPYPMTFDELTDEQWKSAVAMLFTTTYNPANGSNEKGGQYQYKIAAGLQAPSAMKWCTAKLYEQDDNEIRPDLHYYFKYKDHHYIYNFMYVGYDWDESMDANAADQANSLVLGPLALSSYYGLQNYVSTPQFKALCTQNISPAFDYAMRYGTIQNMDASFCDNWYLPSTGELKVLFTNDELFQKYTRVVLKKFYVSGSPSGFLGRIKPSDVFWTSSSNGTQPYNDGGDDDDDTPIYVITRRDRNNSAPPHGRDIGYWGVENETDGDRHNRLQVYDPCTGRIIHPMLNKTLKYIEQPDGIYLELKEDRPKTADKGYAYVYVLYNKAYQIDALGNLSFDTKTESHSVITMRVFE